MSATTASRDHPQTWKVGEIARHSGLTVRALHHYEAIGLFRPSARSQTGHRLYGEADIARLQQIQSLRQLDLTLEQIGRVLQDPDVSAAQIIGVHIKRLRRQITEQKRLCQRLEAIAARLEAGDTVTVDHLIRTLEAIVMVETGFNQEEMDFLKQRAELVGAARIKEVEEREWPSLFDDVRAAMAAGVEPGSARGQELATRWWSLVREFTGGDLAIQRRVAANNRRDPSAGGRMPSDMADMMAWINEAGVPST